MKHTPGPWSIANDTLGVRRIWSKDQNDIAAVGGDGSIPDEEEDANARLIAAAPDLLAACEQSLEDYQGKEPPTHLIEAIRKAKGESK